MPQDDQKLVVEIRTFIEQLAQRETESGGGSGQSRALEVLTDPPSAEAGPEEWMARLFYIVGRDFTEKSFHKAFGRDPEVDA